MRLDALFQVDFHRKQIQCLLREGARRQGSGPNGLFSLWVLCFGWFCEPHPCPLKPGASPPLAPRATLSCGARSAMAALAQPWSQKQVKAGPRPTPALPSEAAPPPGGPHAVPTLASGCRSTAAVGPSPPSHPTPHPADPHLPSTFFWSSRVATPQRLLAFRKRETATPTKYFHKHFI